MRDQHGGRPARGSVLAGGGSRELTPHVAIKHLLLPASVIVALPSLAFAITGQVYADTTRSELLYTMERSASEADGRSTVTRIYRDPQGVEQIKEVYVYEGGELLQFRFASRQTGGSGVYRGGSDRVSFEWTELKGKGREPVTRDASEKRVPDIITADQIAPFLRSNWGTLESGGVVRCRYVVLDRRETIGFEFEKTGEALFDGVPVVTVRMKPKSGLIAMLVDPLFFTVEKEAPHRVLAFEGRVKPKIESDGEWKDLDGFTVYAYGSGS